MIGTDSSLKKARSLKRELSLSIQGSRFPIRDFLGIDWAETPLSLTIVELTGAALMETALNLIMVGVPTRVKRGNDSYRFKQRKNGLNKPKSRKHGALFDSFDTLWLALLANKDFPSARSCFSDRCHKYSGTVYF